MFSDQQKKELAAPLSSSNVKQRSQSGRSLSYIEGWKCIEEANRIFGFDGWVRETCDIKCVSEKEREIGQSKAAGWGVTYTAKVRIRVGEVVRDGIGAGHGIDRDLGQAHESAIKEAETDAMKRALMTFGYPFGLALYDKQQEHVTDAPPVRAVGKISKTCESLIDGFKACKSEDDILKYIQTDAAKKDYASLNVAEKQLVIQAKDARYMAIEGASAA